MSITEKMAYKIGNNAKTFLKVDNEEEEIIIYGAINLFQTVFSVLWVMIAGLLFGVFYETLVFSITASILRKYSGGGHASSPNRCIIIGTISSLLAGIAIDKVLYKFNSIPVILTSAVFLIFAFITIIKYAPVDSIKKPINDIKLKRQFKNKSIITLSIYSAIIIILFLFNQKYSQVCYIKIVESMILGVLWQITTLTKFGISLLNKVDFVLRYIMKGSD